MPRYLIYARKSSESEERQVLSIESQIRELTDFAHSQNLEVALVLSEARSAKAPVREVFGRLLQQVTAGAVDGIICWKLDRLARNPVDGGALIWAFDEGRVSQILTPQRTFTNTGNDKFWMQLEFGMAKKYVDDLSDNVKRGNRAKLGQGWLPGVPPVGYINDLRAKTIVPDPDRFLLVRKMWGLVLSGTPPVRVLDIANEEWGLRTRKCRRSGGRPLAASTFYKLLSNPFYYGLILRKGESYAGAHEPLVTKDQFDAVQQLLGRTQRVPKNRHAFAFTGLIRCGECGAAITAEEKTNRYGSRYTYYHCTKRRRESHCSQKVVRLEALEEQVVETLRRIHIAEDFRDWALHHLRSAHVEETDARSAMDRSLDEAHRDAQKQVDALLDLRLRRLVTDEEYAAKRQKLVEVQLNLKERLADTESRAARWVDLAEHAFTFAREATRRFEDGTIEEKREILVALGSNFVLKDEILGIQLHKPFQMIDDELHSQIHPAAVIRQFEPHLRIAGIRQNGDAVAAIPAWLGLVDRIRTFFIEHPTTIVWPKFCLHESRLADPSSTSQRG